MGVIDLEYAQKSEDVTYTGRMVNRQKEISDGLPRCRTGRSRELGQLGVATQPSMHYPGVIYYRIMAEPYLNRIAQLGREGRY